MPLDAKNPSGMFRAERLPKGGIGVSSMLSESSRVGLAAEPVSKALASRVRGYWTAPANRTGLLWSVIFIVLAFGLYGQGGQDDTYITYWPARVLAEHGQILNYNGVRLEQSSSLSLVVILALIYKLTPFSMPMVGFMTSMAFGVITLLLAERAARRLNIVPSFAVAPVIASVACFACWTTSGMETSLVTASGLLLALALDDLGRARTAMKRWLTPSLAALFFGASRPEAPLVVLAMISGGVVAVLAAPAAPGMGLRSRLFLAGKLVLVCSSALLILVGFRRFYFHAWVPNPASMKAPGFDASEGLTYLWDSFNSNGFSLLALAVLGLPSLALQWLFRRPAALLPSLIAAEMVGHLGFAILSGGDWMAGARFLAPAVPSIVLLGLTAAAPWFGGGRTIWPLSIVLTVSNLFASAQYVRAGENDGRPGLLWARAAASFRQKVALVGDSPIALANKIHERDAATLSHFLPIVARVVGASDRPVWVITGQAGMMGYELMSRFFGRAKLSDLWSLTTRDLYDCLPPGSAPGGKWGTFIDLEAYLDKAKELEKSCGLPPPDIYYNECLDSAGRRLLESHGYRVLYNQTGDVHDLERSRTLPASIPACGSIAVRVELADALDLQPSPDWVWDANPR